MLAPVALPLPMSFQCSRAPAALTLRSLRRPDLRVRTTAYEGLVVDERVLTRGFPAVVGPEWMQVLVVTSGSLVLHRSPAVTLSPGEAWLMPRRALDDARFEDARFFEVDWPAPEMEPLRRLASSSSELVSLAGELGGVGSDGERQRDYLGRVLRALDTLGAPVPPEIARLDGGPSARDLRLGEALAEQLANLKNEGTIPHLGDDAELSARQLQRVIEDFNWRYGLNAKNWRDTRTRWRVQIGVVLLSVPTLSISDVAREVGFSSPTALARAFARWKFPPPTELRATFLTP